MSNRGRRRSRAVWLVACSRETRTVGGGVCGSRSIASLVAPPFALRNPAQSRVLSLQTAFSTVLSFLLSNQTLYLLGSDLIAQDRRSTPVRPRRPNPTCGPCSSSPPRGTVSACSFRLIVVLPRLESESPNEENHLTAQRGSQGFSGSN